MAINLLPYFFDNNFIAIYLCQQTYCQMKEKWISPNTITGDAATEGRYLRRNHINDNFWREVSKGNHILFVAPRRVGKTSVMKDLVENCPPEFACIYQNIEGVKSRNEFYKRLFELILHCIERSKYEKAKAFVAKCYKKYNITEITKSGIKFSSSDLDYEAELRNLIPELKETQIHTVIFLDEFAEVINKLNKQGLQQDAVDILHTLREIRSDESFKHFTLVFAGSIGLQFVIKTIDRPKLINDLHPIETGPLTSAEATDLIAQLSNGASIQLTDHTINHIKKSIHHLLPYYLQLMLEEIDLIAHENNQPVVTTEMIDFAFERVLYKNKNFEDWLERLKEYQAVYFPFINDILKHTAHNNKITIQEIHNKAIDEKFKREEDYMDFVEQLVHDGYLVENNKHVYKFISPFLQKFWLKKYPIYNA